jgi:hypothetical protein
MFPTLGLTTCKNVDFSKEWRKNPFHTEALTEKLMIAREREREFDKFIKLEK